jgi:hypothetical protein
MPDDYFFCDALYGVCFRMVPTPASYDKAKEDCARQGGYLPIYNETAKQVRGLGSLEPGHAPKWHCCSNLRARQHAESAVHPECS